MFQGMKEHAYHVIRITALAALPSTCAKLCLVLWATFFAQASSIALAMLLIVILSVLIWLQGWKAVQYATPGELREVALVIGLVCPVVAGFVWWDHRTEWPLTIPIVVTLVHLAWVAYLYHRSRRVS